MILLLALACATEPTPLSAEKPEVVLVVLDAGRADLGGMDRPEWWNLGRVYTRATAVATATVRVAPVYLTGRPLDPEANPGMGGVDCDGMEQPSQGLPNWPDDIWPERIITDQGALRAMGGPAPIPYEGPGSRPLTRDAVNLIRAGGFRSLVVWSTGPHGPYDGVILRRGYGRRQTQTFNAASWAAGCGRATPDQEGFLRESYRSAYERVLPQAEEVVSAALQAGAVVILASDHGECLGEGGRWSHGGEHAPCVSDIILSVYGPGVVPGEDDRPVSGLCVGQTARAVLDGYLPAGACDLRDGSLPETVAVTP